jgi:hypothetical protein
VIGGWHEKLARASARGYAGMRVTGDSSWPEKKYWKDFSFESFEKNQIACFVDIALRTALLAARSRIT